MKFNNGYWLMRDGVQALFARDAYELHVDEQRKALSVLAPTSMIHERANTLNQPAFNVEITAPSEGVIRVRATHWRAERRALVSRSTKTNPHETTCRSASTSTATEKPVNRVRLPH